MAVSRVISVSMLRRTGEARRLVFGRAGRDLAHPQWAPPKAGNRAPGSVHVEAGGSETNVPKSQPASEEPAIVARTAMAPRRTVFRVRDVIGLSNGLERCSPLH